mmetsp:Transcript_25701/g.61735  ORF Transcript_25701/g.61735 Transcript_25701/m.61735 type:complete len:229 (+) Transcript_25701:1653-2339(+)
MNVLTRGVMTSLTEIVRYRRAPFIASPVAPSNSPLWTCISISLAISDLEYVVPISRPNTLFKTNDKGLQMGYNKTMMTFTAGTVFSPTCKAKREHIACGMISPKITITAVDTRNPTRPEVKSAMRMDSMEFTPTFPRSKVHKRRLPLMRTGYIALAARAIAGSSELAMTISRPLGSNDMRPRVNPENSAEKATKIIISIYCTATCMPTPPSLFSFSMGHGLDSVEFSS